MANAVNPATIASAVSLTVADSGKGLSNEQINNIFEPFWRANSNQPGLGVGLSIVSALVAAHAGTITVYSEGEGLGSSFEVKIPRQVLPEDIAVVHDTDALGSTGTHSAAVDQSRT
jgi:signal transduction histidine kinase